MPMIIPIPNTWNYTLGDNLLRISSGTLALSSKETSLKGLYLRMYETIDLDTNDPEWFRVYTSSSKGRIDHITMHTYNTFLIRLNRWGRAWVSLDNQPFYVMRWYINQSEHDVINGLFKRFGIKAEIEPLTAIAQRFE